MLALFASHKFCFWLVRRSCLNQPVDRFAVPAFWAVSINDGIGAELVRVNCFNRFMLFFLNCFFAKQAQAPRSRTSRVTAGTAHHTLFSDFFRD